MSLRRFHFLLQSIRFDNIIVRPARRALDKLAAFRNVFDLFNRNCVNNYVLSSFATIDEQLVAFCGRCPFRQFMKSKPAKYGIKIFTITDAKMFYVHNMEVYVGNQPGNSPFVKSNKPKDVVLFL
uniref:PiggyBac transposable element-derived protein domain-containing protein n=1 Tax=Clastoptera arizonana TaxID=38151 RepID=A0A1B6C4G3_9HEMI